MLFVARWVWIGANILPDTWFWDFKYFWQAGADWLLAQSPYDENYLNNGGERFDHFTNPFFYPPNALPLFALFASLPPELSAKTFFTLNGALVIGLSALCAGLGRQMGAKTPYFLLFAVTLAVIGLYMRPTYRVATFGQMAIIVAFGFSLFLATRHNKNPVLSAIGLTMMLIKPHFALPALAYALFDPKTRMIGILAAGATTILGLIALLYIGPVEMVTGFLRNISLYSSMDDNNAISMSGITALSTFIPVLSSPIVKLIVLLVPTLLIARLAQSTDRYVEGACAAVCWAFIASPYHSTDFVILAPMVVVAFGAGASLARVAAIVGLLILSQSWNIVRLIPSPDEWMRGIAGTVHMTGLTLVFLGLLAILLQGSTVKLLLRKPSIKEA